MSLLPSKGGDVLNLVRRRRSLAALGLLFTLFLIVGCSSNPTNRWAQARSTLTTAQDSVLIAHTAGLVSDATLVAADPIAQATRAALDKAETYLPDGGTNFESYMGIVDSMLARLEQMAIAGQLQLE